MEEHDQAPAEQQNDASGTPAKSKGTVEYSTYQKTLSAEKNAKAKLSELQTELERIRQEKDLAEGNKDKVIEELRKHNDLLKSEFNKTKQTYAWSTLTGEIKREALKSGCKDPDKLIRLMSDEDLRAIEVGDNFSIDSGSLKEVIERSKKDNYFLFESSPKQVAPGLPGKKPPEENDITKLSKEEILARLKRS